MENKQKIEQNAGSDLFLKDSVCGSDIECVQPCLVLIKKSKGIFFFLLQKVIVPHARFASLNID